MRITLSVDIPFHELPEHDLLHLRNEADKELARRAPPPILLTQAEKCLSAGGCTIEAIKMVRERLKDRPEGKPGLREVKDAIDAHRRSIGWREENGVLQAP